MTMDRRDLIRIPFVDHQRKIFQWALFPDIWTRVVRWNDVEWMLRVSTGSTYYVPTQNLLLPGISNDGVILELNMKFKDMPLGTRFQCWGDIHSNYTSPTWITLEKTGPNTATEVDERDGHLGQHNAMSDDDEFDGRHIIRVGPAK